MTNDEIIEMARQARLMSEYDESSPWVEDHEITEYVVAFAKLIADKEREVIADEFWSCVMSDLEHGVKSLNEKASFDFQKNMPDLSKFGRWLNERGEA